MAGFTVNEIDKFIITTRERLLRQPPGKQIAAATQEAILKNLRAAFPFYYDGKIKAGVSEEAAKAGAMVAINLLVEQSIQQRKVVPFEVKTAAQIEQSKANAASTFAAVVSKDKGSGSSNVGTLPADFDEKIYLENNPDIQEAVKKGSYPSGANHFINFGWKEERVYSSATLAAKNTKKIASDQQSLIKKSSFEVLTNMAEKSVKQDAATGSANEQKTNYWYWLAGGVAAIVLLKQLTAHKKKKR